MLRQFRTFLQYSFVKFITPIIIIELILIVRSYRVFGSIRQQISKIPLPAKIFWTFFSITLIGNSKDLLSSIIDTFFCFFISFWISKLTFSSTTYSFPVTVWRRWTFPLLAILFIISTLSLIFKVVISGEVYSQPQYGIGTIIQFEKMQLNTSRIIAWMIIITGIVFLFDLIISRIFKKHKL